MKKIFTLFLAIVFALVLNAQSNKPSAIPEELRIRKEMYISIHLNDNMDVKMQLEELGKTVSIDSYNDETKNVIAYVSINKFKEFSNQQFEYDILTPPSLLLPRSELDKDPAKSTNDWDYYPNYAEYIDMMNQFVTDYPNLCEVVNIGQTNEGRDILFIHINDSLNVDQAEPEFMYTSSIHGDELTGYVLMLRYIDYLLSNYETDERVANMVNNIDIWINPMANPDGTFAGGNSSVYGATRYNAMGIDMNRNFADPEDGPHPDGNSYQTETVHFMNFAEERDFVMSANFHGGAEVINYPWDTWSRLAADDDWWYYVSKEYADTAHLNSPNGYLVDLNNGITNGYAWYSISGGRQDYMNYFEHCREVTVEISGTKLPSASQLPGYWDYNYKSLLNYMEQVMYGVRGVVTDAFYGNPVAAKVLISFHDMDESYIYSTSDAGGFSRLLKSGTYSLTFTALGYFDQTISGVEVNDRETTWLNVQLEPTVGTIETHNNQVTVFPNPAKEYIKINMPNSTNNLIKIYDVAGKLIYEETTNNSSLNIKLNTFSSGNYVISVSNKNGELFNSKLVIE